MIIVGEADSAAIGAELVPAGAAPVRPRRRGRAGGIASVEEAYAAISLAGRHRAPPVGLAVEAEPAGLWQQRTMDEHDLVRNGTPGSGSHTRSRLSPHHRLRPVDIAFTARGGGP